MQLTPAVIPLNSAKSITKHRGKGCHQNSCLSKFLKHDSISMDEIKSLANRWGQRKDGLVDKLSGSKNTKINREEWWSSLRLATIYLTELLQSLDPAKLEKRI